MSTDRKFGTIIRLVRDRAFGFIHVDNDRDYFFHQAQLANCAFGQLTDGDVVSFTVGAGPKGKIEAQDVRREEHAPAAKVDPTPPMRRR